MATGKQQVTSTFKPTAFCVTLFPPRSSPCHSILISAQMGKSAARKVHFFLSDSGLAARGEGDCGKAGRRGSDVVWPLASFRCSAPRTDGITKDYRATLGSSVCVFIVCLCACAVRLGVCVQACALGPMLRGEWTWVCVCVCVWNFCPLWTAGVPKPVELFVTLLSLRRAQTASRGLSRLTCWRLYWHTHTDSLSYLFKAAMLALKNYDNCLPLSLVLHFCWSKYQNVFPV